MGRRGYPPEFRRKVLDLVEAGRPIAEIAQALGISDQSISTWRRQDRIVRGLDPGLSSAEQGELAAASGGSPNWRLNCARCAGRWSWCERWCPQTAVPGGHGDGRRAHPDPGRLPGPGRVDLGLLRLAVPATIRAGDPPCLADRSDRRGPPALPGTYGALRVHAELRLGRGILVGHNAVALLMRRASLAGATGRPNWRHAKPDQVAADLVDRNFARSGPNQLWVTDIAEHPTGKLYCAVVLDAYSRRVVGWSIDASPTAALVTNALGMAIQTRTPPAGAVIHSDQSAGVRLLGVHPARHRLRAGALDGLGRRLLRQRDGRGVLVADAGRAARPSSLDDPGGAGQRDL